MSERLQELDRLKEDFVSHLSHTLRTPLTAIREASEMLNEGTFAGDRKSQSQLMSIIRDECKRLILKVEAPAAAGGLLQVSVTDTGCGIEPHNLQNIFDKFRRIEKGQETIRGSGLGLAIARHIVKAHGGSIWVESTKGCGSTFYFSLPPA